LQNLKSLFPEISQIIRIGKGAPEKNEAADG